ncbi:MAG: RNA polymerase sigma factor [Caulobacteraceae bacterium]
MAVDPNDKANWAKLLQRIKRIVARREDAEDLLQQAYERLERFRAARRVDNPAGFLVRAAVNIGIDEQRRDRHIERAYTVHRDGLGIADSAPMQDEVLAARQRLERVRLGLTKLSVRTREVFLMHRLEGLKYREIALRLGISQSAVEKHIAKAAVFLAGWTDGW